MQEIVVGRQGEDEETREAAGGGGTPAILRLGTGGRYCAKNYCASSRVEVIYGILVTTDVACVTENSLCIEVYCIVHCFKTFPCASTRQLPLLKLISLLSCFVLVLTYRSFY